MSLLLLCFFLLEGSGHPIHTGGEIFKPLTKGDFALTANGNAYLLDYDEARVSMYDKNGSFKGFLGNKGQGPGEFSYPGKVWARNNQVFVFDMADVSISEFNHDGTFVSKFAFPERGIQVKPSANGWVYGNWPMSRNPNAPSELKLTDSQGKVKETIASWERKKSNNVIMIRGGEKPKVPLSPFSDRIYLEVSPSGNLAYLAFPGDINVKVYNLDTMKLERTITYKVQAIPYNKTWGSAWFEEAKESRKNLANRITFVPEHPEFFPIVRSFSLAASGDLVFSLWTADPDNIQRSLVLNPEGKEAKLPYNPKNEDRILAIKDGMAFISTFEEEAGFAKVPVNRVDPFVEQNPIHYDGPTERFMVQMH